MGPRQACGVALAVALGLGGCGGQHHRTRTLPSSRHSRVDVYASLPLHGNRAVQADGVLNGIRLAYKQAHRRAGRWRVRLVVRDDSTPQSGGWDAGATAHNARAAASDSNAVYYIGELDSAASEISGPILNAAGIPQVSPLSSYDALTSGPLDRTGSPTFLRLAPSDSVQAGAQLEAAMRARCNRVAVVHDGTLDGTGLAAQLLARHGQFGVQIGSERSLSAVVADLGAYIAAIKAHNDRCLIFAGSDSPSAVALFSNVAAAFPRLVRGIGSDGVCTEPFTGAIAGPAVPAFRCTSPAGDLRATSEGRAFLAAYSAAYHAVPDPLAVYGYESMKLALDTISGLGARGDDKGAVRDALFAVKDRHSAIGTYGFDREGDSTVGSYGLYHVGAGGLPAFVQELSP